MVIFRSQLAELKGRNEGRGNRVGRRRDEEGEEGKEKRGSGEEKGKV